MKTLTVFKAMHKHALRCISMQNSGILPASVHKYRKILFALEKIRAKAYSGLMEKDNIDQIIEECATPEFIASVQKLIAVADTQDITQAAQKVAVTFGAQANQLDNSLISGEAETKLVSSFHKNLMLLIQKTWVEKPDESTKQQVLYQLEQFCAEYQNGIFGKAYKHLLSIITDAVYLMFGSLSKGADFCEYALRVDPEFGIFWWYITNLPKDAQWSGEKYRCAIILGMFFLANY